MNLRLNIFTIFLKKRFVKNGRRDLGILLRDPAGPNTIVEEPQIIEIITKLPSRENYSFYSRIVGGLVPKQNVQARSKVYPTFHQQ